MRQPRQHSGLALLAAMVLAAAESPPSMYYHFQNITKAGDYETGHTRGNPGHWIARQERQEGHNNQGHVRWYGEGSSGLQVWDFGHVGLPEGSPAPPSAAAAAAAPYRPSPYRKSGGSGSGVHPDCILGRRRRRRGAHATLITRDCAGNPLEPPGVRLSPGTPRPQLQPRSPPPPPRQGPTQPRRQQQPTAPPATDVFLQMNKRVGAVAAALDPPRGFEASAEQQDQEVQEDHLRGMKHADKPLMFGDGSYHAAAAAGALRQLKLPMQITGHVVKGPMKGPITIKVAKMPMGAMGGPVRARPMMSRVKPVLLLVRPVSSNRMPFGGKGPAAASKPMHFTDWLKSMWKGG